LRLSAAEAPNIEHRLDGDTDPAAIAERMTQGERVIVQFGAATYTKKKLGQLDRLAEQFGSALQIRFFGHYGSRFDLKTLLQLPHVANLAVDALHEATNFEVLQELECLRALNVGVFLGTPDEILSYPSLRGLERLVLGGGSSNSLVLDSLAGYRRLADLHITGYTKGIEQLAEIKCLKRLSLSGIGNRQSLSFVSNLSSLREFSLLLGGRKDIEEVVNPFIEEMEIIRVRGFSHLHAENFVGLQHLQIHDQLQLCSLVFSGASRKLRSLYVANCKSLQKLEGLNALGNLEQLRIYLTSINFDSLVQLGLSSSLKTFAFHERSRRADAVIQKKLTELGFAGQTTR
jgi:protein phosphatase 1 regulatory subunit 7